MQREIYEKFLLFSFALCSQVDSKRKTCVHRIEEGGVFGGSTAVADCEGPLLLRWLRKHRCL